MNAFRYQDDAHTNIDFNNSSIQVRSSDYTGTDRDIKRAFNLTHNQNPFFEKSFEGNDSAIINTTDENSIVSEIICSYNGTPFGILIIITTGEVKGMYEKISATVPFGSSGTVNIPT